MILFATYTGNSLAAQAAAAFDPSPDDRVVGYKLYYGLSRNFDHTVDLGASTRRVVGNLEEGSVYYFAATGYDRYGLESSFSDIVAYKVPVSKSDGDADGVPDDMDLCPDDPDKSEPGQCGCGFADIDSDGDRVLDCLDDCPLDPAKTSPGFCGCGCYGFGYRSRRHTRLR